MKQALFLFLFLAGIGLTAQPRFKFYYPDYDSCPDPLANHIASRTITLTDSVMWRFITRIEYYDPQGKIVKVEESGRSATAANGRHHSNEYFRYDALNRIDSFSVDGDTIPGMKSSLFYSKFTYDTVARSIRRLDNTFGIPITSLNYYNEDNKIITTYLIGPNGDTSQRITINGDTTIMYYYRENPEGVYSLRDKTTIITSSATKSYYFWSSNGSESRYVYYYNAEHQLTKEVMSNRFRSGDSTTYTYKKNRLTEAVRYLEPRGFTLDDTIGTTWHDKYTYNKKGQLIEIRKVSGNPKEKIKITRYEYNNIGLRTRWQEIEADGKRERVMRDERWAYEYY